MKTFIAFVCIFVMFSGRSYGEGAGSSSLYSLISPSSARGAALSGAGVSLKGSVSLMQYNPASLLGISDYSLSASYQSGMAKEHYAGILFGAGFENSAVGGGIKYYDTGEISIYDMYGYEVTKTGQRDVIFNLTSAQDFEYISLGLSLKMFFSEIFGETAFGFASDIGSILKVSENINAALAVQNAGTPVKYIKEKEPLPLIIRSGASFRGQVEDTGYILSLDFPYYVNERNLFLKPGLELMLHELLTFRAGGIIAAGRDNKTDGVLSIGWSFGTENIRLDYAVKVTDEMNMPQFITTEFNF